MIDNEFITGVIFGLIALIIMVCGMVNIVIN